MLYDGTAATLCTSGAQMLDDDCYYISPSTVQVSWFVARMSCLARGGDLVKLTSPAVWNTLKSAISPNRRSYWIGLSAMYWYWSNGMYFVVDRES